MSDPSASLIGLDFFQRQWADTSEAVLSAVRKVGESGWYVLGREVSTFEERLAESLERRHVIGCASGLDAIEIALRALGIAPGQKVLTTPLSAFATALAVVRAGALPVFVDVDASGLIDLDLAEREFERDPDLRFFLPVHLYGQCLDLQRLEALQSRFGLRLVEDCAQAVCARSAGRVAGSVGQISATSFYPTKNLGALGDGGALFTSDDELARAARALRDYGQSAKYVHDALGLNSRLDELQAAILTHAYLPRLSAWTDRRRAIAARYREDLQNPLVEVLPAPANSESVWHLFPVLVPAAQRGAFLNYLKSAGILGSVHYPELINEQKALANVPFEVRGELLQARAITQREVSLPIHPYLTDLEVARVIASVNAWRPS
jgi:dTDP-3-amino-3,4,6-trideoxy-alpha-D-glucose transaminase